MHLWQTSQQIRGRAGRPLRGLIRCPGATLPTLPLTQQVTLVLTPPFQRLTRVHGRG